MGIGLGSDFLKTPGKGEYPAGAYRYGMGPKLDVLHLVPELSQA